MRYLILTYYRKAGGQIDEVMAVSKRIKMRDTQTANVILDFQEQKVLRCHITGENGIQDWDTVVAYYYKFYANVIERLFTENGHAMPADTTAQPVDQ